MAAKKVKETPDFVKGLLTSADGISTLLNPDKMPPRLLLKKLQDDKVTLGQFTSEECQELGMYQARVVLMVLAAELALNVDSLVTRPLACEGGLERRTRDAGCWSPPYLLRSKQPLPWLKAVEVVERRPHGTAR